MSHYGEQCYAITRINTAMSVHQSFLSAVFAIDPLSGEIRTLVSIDREVIGFYNITVAAMDGGTPSLTTNVEVIITVGDVNDNDPIIDESSLRGANGTIQVFEVGDM